MEAFLTLKIFWLDLGSGLMAYCCVALINFCVRTKFHSNWTNHKKTFCGQMDIYRPTDGRSASLGRLSREVDVIKMESSPVLDTQIQCCLHELGHVQKLFRISEVTADWHEPMIPQRTMWPSIARISEHFRDSKAPLVTMTHVRSAIASTGPLHLPFLPWVSQNRTTQGPTPL